jgi:Tfp pilus assembly protein PilN
MIRINLIGLKTKRAKAVQKGGKAQLILFAVVLLAEVAFLFLWHQRLTAELEEAKKRTRDATAKIEDLKRVKVAWEAWQAEKADLEAQEQVFDRLRADQLGPPAMLEYVAYALTPLVETAVGSDEARAQELVGWNPKWDPRRVWVKSMREDAGKIVFQGEAVDHEDVAEFYRRLEASGFFLNVEPGSQTRKVHVDLGIKYVEFEVTMGLSYLAVLEPADVAAAEAVVPAAGQEPGAQPAAPAAPAQPTAPGAPGAPAGPGVPVGPGGPTTAVPVERAPAVALLGGAAGMGR